MKKVQLGLLAVALFGAVAAFATTSDDVPDGWYSDLAGSQPFLGADPVSDCPNEIPDICAVHYVSNQIQEVRTEKLQ